jgi:hypothetical protein
MTESGLNPLEELTVLLLYAPSRPGGESAPIPGKVHLAKELFLLWKNDLFRPKLRGVLFEPYRFGPWSDAIDAALDELVSRDVVRIRPSGRAQAIALTREGESKAAGMWKESSPETRAILTDIKSNLNPLSTDALLSRIYSAYPEFAVASEWKGSRTPG